MQQKRIKSRQMNIFACILEPYLKSTQNNPQSTKIRTANAIKPVKKLANERFCPYLGNGTFDRLKITSKVLKIKH